MTALSASWFFGEGYTGGTPDLSFDTFLLLSNPGSTPANATVTFLLEGAPPIVKQYPLLPTSRQNVWVDLIAGLEAAPFSMRVEADQPIAAERAMYWGPAGRWIEGHNTPGVTESAKIWAFAEGAEDGVDTTGLAYDSYFLLANPSSKTLSVRATFLREDGTGVVQTFDVARESRFTLATSLIPELSSQRFAAFFESTNDVPFVAERAMYWGEGYFGGHASTGTPWIGAIATPGTPALPLIASVSPASGPSSGGTRVTISGTNFRAGSVVTFGGAPATNVVVLNSTTITASTPAGLPGTVGIVVTAGSASTSMAGAFAYLQNAPTITGVSPATGPSTGGTTITITGTNLSNVTGVSVGGISATAVTVVNATTVTAKTAPHGVGLVDVSVTTSTGNLATDPSAFTYTLATATDNILAFGDSITRGTTSQLGVDANGTFWFTTSYFSMQPYPAVLFNKLRSRYTTQSFVVQNAGLPGECVYCNGGGGVVRFPTTLNAFQDLAVILEGVNDLNASAPDFDRVIRNLRTMVQTARTAGKAVMLGTLTPVTYSEANVKNGCTGDLCYKGATQASVDTLNGLIRSLAAEPQWSSVYLVDFDRAFRVSGNADALLSPDGLHPNDAGYDVMAQKVFEKIQENFETVRPIDTPPCTDPAGRAGPPHRPIAIVVNELPHRTGRDR